MKLFGMLLQVEYCGKSQQLACSPVNTTATKGLFPHGTQFFQELWLHYRLRSERYWSGNSLLDNKCSGTLMSG